MERFAGWVFGGIFYLSLFSPLLMMAVVWKRLIHQPKDNYAITIATVASLSYGFLLAALFFKSSILGPDYSDRLFTSVAANTVVALILALLAAFRKTVVRGLLALGAFTISLAWFLVWAINAAV